MIKASLLHGNLTNMTIFKKNFLLLTLAASAVLLEKPITAFAELLGSYETQLQGNWGSSGVQDSPIPMFSPTDNPKYLCQWQIFNNQEFINEENLKFKKINWTSFEVDTKNTSFKSTDLKWTVAYVLSENPDYLNAEDLIESRTKETSNVSNLLNQFLYFGFIPNYNESNEFSYELSIYISLKQQVDGVIVGGNKQSQHSRDQEFLESDARVDVQRASENRSSRDLNPLNSQIHCKKIN